MTEPSETAELIKLIAIYRDAVRRDWDDQADETLAKMQEAEQAIILKFAEMEKENDRLKELLESETFYLEAAQREITRRKKYE